MSLRLTARFTTEIYARIEFKTPVNLNNQVLNWTYAVHLDKLFCWNCNSPLFKKNRTDFLLRPDVQDNWRMSVYGVVAVAADFDVIAKSKCSILVEFHAWLLLLIIMLLLTLNKMQNAICYFITLATIWLV